MSNFFTEILNGPKKLTKSFLGQDYNYKDHIKSPQELGMRSDGTMSAIASNVDGLISYVELLVAGGGKATKGGDGGPLGDKFFLKTGGQCTDILIDRKVDRYIYIDNVPDGSIPFITSGINGVKLDSMKGLVPGVLTNMSRIEPTKIFGAFMMGAEPKCIEVTKKTIDENGRHSSESHHLIKTDIAAMSDGKNDFTNDLNKFNDIESTLNNPNISMNDKRNHLAKYRKEGFTSANKGTNNRGRAKRPYAPRHPYATIMPYGPDRPYDSTEQNAYKPLYLKEGPYVPKMPPLPSHVMPVAIVPDFKIDEIIHEKEEENEVYAPDITHDQNVATVPQIQKVIINHNTIISEDDDDDDDDHISKLPTLNKMPDDIYIKMYYSSLGLLGLYIFLKLFEKKYD
jgi:hypothetical protein